MSKKYLLSLSLFLSACVNPNFQAIEGKQSPDVRAIKGDPVSVIKENGHEMWTYKKGSCTQIVFFDQSGAAADWNEMGDCKIDE